MSNELMSRLEGKVQEMVDTLELYRMENADLKVSNKELQTANEELQAAKSSPWHYPVAYPPSPGLIPLLLYFILLFNLLSFLSYYYFS